MSAERRVAGGGQQRAADRQGNVLLGYLGTSSSITYRPLVIHRTDRLLSSVYFERGHAQLCGQHDLSLCLDGLLYFTLPPLITPFTAIGAAARPLPSEMWANTLIGVNIGRAR